MPTPEDNLDRLGIDDRMVTYCGRLMTEADYIKAVKAEEEHARHGTPLPTDHPLRKPSRPLTGAELRERHRIWVE